ncbi:hypothetical protein P152DRAFT_419818 [Eremomyces bilateralis CBS 781.70]|uniref:Uncharacterized protein n=1 Tax=Eremomyces bilateralis CBS 781.70 TaxID=1392243 RepID=A0A6G1FZU9_9PEZI|nr:uncharacterized protein P152DRAFT_419818 [Eremomyces bilateralis CBS 781.70]KAF1811089.1 hypothetical protein P152DRAFT_419818 [Eremomyces bilateralis CBS 781.70]
MNRSIVELILDFRERSRKGIMPFILCNITPAFHQGELPRFRNHMLGCSLHYYHLICGVISLAGYVSCGIMQSSRKNSTPEAISSMPFATMDKLHLFATELKSYEYGATPV